MALDAGHVLASAAGAMVLACLSFPGSLNRIVAWTLRVAAWLLLATVFLSAP